MTPIPAGERLAPVDEANLVLDHAGQVNVFLVAGVLAAGGFVGPDGVPDLTVVRAVVGERIAALPRLRLLAVRDGRRHRWAEVSPDLRHHIRLVAAVPGPAGLERLCGELMSVPLPRYRPLWELLLVPGANAVGVGMVLRVHHALADGLGAVSIVQQLFDPGGASPPDTAPPPPATAAGGRRDLRRVLRRAVVRGRRIGLTLTGREVGPTPFLGERSAHRGVAFLDADLAAVGAHARAVGATVNDALLSAVASGYRAALPTAGEGVPADLPVSVPVALQRRGSSGNHVGVMLVHLPLGEPDPARRLRLIAARTRSEKVEARQQGTLEFMRGPLGARILDRVAHRQHLVAGFVTDVPGPGRALQLAGAPVTDIWPVAVLAANVRLGVAAVSYDGRLRCSVHFDAASVPGAVFARGMAEEFVRLSGRPAADRPV
ncbi:wax ester/triacylglycerol synthase domain-containing protein [Arthrobacter antioxidans]|uniref:wax ester/triacylglycerol synthase domain-containing protein n=1 Tax=Arthrobacter antioxidans TaxID=2895818 RepID=UPI001FFF2048|nr:wax ester/triacylglycerol synthase domain-containing protein [Arthrobacter antioxidans]